jgi:two-component system, cell cycle sensor histidine kinase and response regulator CckA
MPRRATASIYALALESGLPVAILIERVGGEVVLVNDGFRTMFDLAETDLEDPLGAAAATFHEPDAFVDGRSLEAVPRQDRLRQRSGRTIDRKVRSLYDGGALTGWVWSCTDVTEQQEAVGAIARVTDFHRRVLDALPAQLAVFSPSGVYEYVTPSAIGDPEVREWIVGKTDEQYGAFRGLPAAVSQQRTQLIRDVVENGQSKTFEESFLTRTGERRYFRRFLSPVYDTNGVIQHILGYGLDITEQRITEDQLRHAQKIDAIGRLAAGVAHDFNNLLTVILGCGEELREEIDADDERQRLVEGILDAGDRATDLTKQLLSFSRRAAAELQVLNVNTVVENTLTMLRRLLGEQITIRLALSSEPAAVRADPGQLEQVLLNLSVNARDAMAWGGTLTLSTRHRRIELPVELAALGLPRGEYVELLVADTGTGMTEEVRAHLFEPFFTTKPIGKGTGLGLSMVYGIVTQAGGQLQVDSTVGVGSTFRVLFPAVAIEAAPFPSGAHTPPLIPTAGKETLLLVEDEVSVRTFIERALSRLGYTVLCAGCGSEAVRLANAYPGVIDLMIADVVMPDFGGRELLRAIEETRPQTRVLFISGYSNRHAVVDITSPREAFLQKPFGIDALTALLRALLDTATGAPTLPPEG